MPPTSAAASPPLQFGENAAKPELRQDHHRDHGGKAERGENGKQL
jgi:hypothetical protein